MFDSLLKKIKVFGKKTSSENFSYARLGIMPAHDWALIFSVTLVSLFSIGIFSYYIYVLVNNGTLVTVPDTNNSTQITIDTNLLKKVSTDIATRDARRGELEAHGSATTDPSL